MLEKKHLALLALGTSLSFWDIFNVPYIVNYASKIFNVSQTVANLPLSSEMLGYFLGGAINGFIASKFGRKKGLIFTMGLISLGSILGLLSPNFYYLVVAELIIGMGIEGEVAIVPSYIAEMVTSRGRTIGLVEASGFLMSLVVGPVAVLAGTRFWRLLFLAGVLIAVPSFAFRFLLPESKMWEATSTQKAKWDPVVFAFLLAWFLSYFAGYALFSEPVFSLITSKGFENSSLYFTYVLYGDPLGVVVASLVNDKLERKFTSFASNFASGVLMLAWPLVSGLSFLAIGFAIMFFQGFKFPVCYTYTAENIGTKLRTIGFGIADGLGHLGGVLGPLALSFFYGQNVELAFAVTAIASMVAGAMFGIYGVRTKNLPLEKIKG
ncbi:MAG: MFS transporter [Candidatus Aramenus sp.]|nr:MFS transporter [Candidatus Aramenus sp.]